MEDAASGINRRDFLKAAGLGAAGRGRPGRDGRRPAGLLAARRRRPAATTTLALAATDGYMSPCPAGRTTRSTSSGSSRSARRPTRRRSSIRQYKGHAQHTAPTLDFQQNDDIKITLTNLGLVQRPDLTDSHTIHWHGFDIPSPLNDGVPEVSVAVPIGKQLTYFYRPHREGTYMYHCHFEDVEHVQMGMTGIVFVRPLQDGTLDVGGASPKFAYNDGDGSTGYHRHFAILLERGTGRTSTTATATSRSRSPPTTTPQWFTLNGRCYPQTAAAERRPALPATLRIATPNPNYDDAPDYSQPNSALIQVNPGDRVAAAAGQPGLPAARDATARASRCTSSGRTPRCCATAASTPRTGPTRSTSGPARRATCCSTHRRTPRPGRPARDGARQLQRLLLQEPGLAQVVEPRRARARAE